MSKFVDLQILRELSNVNLVNLCRCLLLTHHGLNSVDWVVSFNCDVEALQNFQPS